MGQQKPILTFNQENAKSCPWGGQPQHWCVLSVHPGAEQAQGVLINVRKHLKADCKENSAWLFPVVPSGRTRHHGHKLKCWRVSLHVKTTFFPARVTKSWPRLLREIVKSPSLGIFQDVVLGSWCLVALPEQGGTRYTLELPLACQPVTR